MLPERADSLIGTMLGKDYRVLERLGSGGMAVVYLVEHQTLLKQFAAKVLSNELASSLEARARFAQEAHAASQLDHENIVSISDFGVTTDHRPFFVMELLRGQTLEQRLADGPISIEEVVAISVPVARALAHAHAEGIVHRDIKPENIFLVQRSQGRWGVKVVDFGIAKTPVHPKLTHTKPKLGETLGSPKYMSPEMCRGDDEEVDQRADVYSFGVVLYLMLCGQLPFEDDNLLRMLQMHLSEPLPPPREVKPDLAPELAAVLERALAKHPDDRYPSMDALLLDLEAALPSGSDRLLIEAQSGTTLGGTPFAGALSSPRISAQRAAAQPPSISGVLPVAPRRSRARIVVGLGVLAAAAIGAVAWREIAAPDRPGTASIAPAKMTAAPAAVAKLEVTPTPELPPPAGREVLAPSGSVHAPAESSVAIAAPASPRPGRAAPVAKRNPALRPGVVRDRRRPGPNAGAPPALAEAAPGTAETAEPAQVAAAPISREQDAPPPAADASGASDRAGSAAPPPVTAPVTTPPAPPAAAPVAPPEAPPIAAPRPAPAPPRPTGSLDAVPEIASFEVQGSLSPSIVRRSVERSLPALRACYRTAARAGRATPAIDLQLNFEIDENGLAVHVTTGQVSLGALARCAAGVAGQIHTPVAPDIGTAQVAIVIRFRPS